MRNDAKKPFAGVDLARARSELEGAVVDDLESDFWARDAAGRIAVFLGTDASPTPDDDAAEVTVEALEAILTSVKARLSRNPRRRAGRLPDRGALRRKVATFRVYRSRLFRREPSSDRARAHTLA